MDDIFEQCKKRQQEGLVQYGEFDSELDDRCMYTEMEEELLDVINYAYFEILKIRQLKINKIAIEK
tara:strand:- start:252 stop:449 length:198 start_codon:yes stop_codon:yes gene_type:complete